MPGAATHSAGTPSASTVSHLASGAPPSKSAIFSNRMRASATSGTAGDAPERRRVTRLSSWMAVIGELREFPTTGLGKMTADEAADLEAAVAALGQDRREQREDVQH